MSKATKRKHVTREILDEFTVPEGNQEIVKIQASRGNNLHEVENAEMEKYLVSMPTKFRKNVWIKRGDFVIVEPIEEGDKVKAEIVKILYKDQIKYIKEEGKWPDRFKDGREGNGDAMIPDDLLPPSDEDSDNDQSETVVNANRPNITYSDSDLSSDEDNESSEPPTKPP